MSEFNQYKIEMHRMTTEDDAYYFAFLPDWGASTCSYIGESPDDAVGGLLSVFKDVSIYYEETGKPIPEPSPLPEFLKGG
jgi:predicted RNase H-like HicB family nuclease